MKKPEPDEETIDSLTPDHETNRIYLGYRGSISHGIYNPPEDGGIDDIDLFSVYIANKKEYLGLRSNRHDRGHDYEEGHWDCVNYEFLHFLSMAIGCNPNIMSAIWTGDEFIIDCKQPFSIIRDNRDLFRSRKQIFDSYRGYAKGQYDRMQKDRQNLEEIKKLQKLENHKEVRELDHEEQKTYDRLSSKYFSGHMGKKRKKMVTKYGFDPKHASHAVRLLRMGVEFLKNGRPVIDRREAGDADELLSIKNGEWDYNEVCYEIGRQEARIEDAYNNSDLQKEVPEDKVDDLIYEILIDYFGFCDG